MVFLLFFLLFVLYDGNDIGGVCTPVMHSPGGMTVDDGWHPRVQIADNIIVKSNYDFLYEHWKEARLKLLYDQESFKDLEAESQLEYFAKL